MHALPDIAWLAIGLLIGMGVLLMLRLLAITVRNETMIHDLRVGVGKIQVEQFHAEMLRHGLVPTVTEATPDGDATPPEMGVEVDPEELEGGSGGGATPARQAA